MYKKKEMKACKKLHIQKYMRLISNENIFVADKPHIRPEKFYTSSSEFNKPSSYTDLFSLVVRKATFTTPVITPNIIWYVSSFFARQKRLLG